ncbi:AI-2E family transporter, partial [Bacillaceae bacterium Marseille-Q3522]|nr:AI-2E family transporter [Bacillaceae bacterium Marseille-Q3522]
MDVIRFFQKKSVKRIISFSILALLLFLSKSMINFILLTFIFSYLMDRLTTVAVKFTHFNRRLTVAILYLLIIGLLTIGLTTYLPIITAEISQLLRQFTAFYSRPHDNVVLN